MTATNRTPWTLLYGEPDENGKNHTGIYSEAGEHIATIHTQDKGDGELIALAPEMADSLTDAEAAIGENLVWITDCADLLVRQKDPEALRRLKQINDAWLSLVKITSRLPKGE